MHYSVFTNFINTGMLVWSMLGLLKYNLLSVWVKMILSSANSCKPLKVMVLINAMFCIFSWVFKVQGELRFWSNNGYLWKKIPWKKPVGCLSANCFKVSSKSYKHLDAVLFWVVGLLFDSMVVLRQVISGELRLI